MNHRNISVQLSRSDSFNSGYTTAEISPVSSPESSRKGENRTSTIGKVSFMPSPETIFLTRNQDIETVSFSELLRNLNSDKPRIQAKAIRDLRGADEHYTPQQGIIPVYLLNATRDAICNMAAAVKGADLVLGIDRGGGMLVSYLEKLLGTDSSTRFVRIAKGAVRGSEMSDLLNQIRLVRQRNPSSRIVVVETCISGSSVATLVDAIYRSEPDGAIEIHALTQEKGVIKPNKIPTRPSVKLTKYLVPYLIAEDVNYQISDAADRYGRPVKDVKMPISVLVNNQLIQFYPKATAIARDVMVELVAGNSLPPAIVGFKE